MPRTRLLLIVVVVVLLLPLSPAQLFCPIGSVQRPGSSVCKCPPQKFLRDDFICTCFPGTTPSGLHKCERCSGKALGSLNDAACTYCRAGEGFASTECTRCRAGSVQGKSRHLDECKRCPKGRVSAAGAESCSTRCPRGTVQKGKRKCLPCARGSFGGGGGGKCRRCRPGTFASEGGAVACDKCRAGTQANGFGSIKCDECDEGSVASRRGTVVCRRCAEGSMADEERRKCVRDTSLLPSGSVRPSAGGMMVG